MSEKNPVLEAISEVKSDLKGQIDSVKSALDKQVEDRIKEINEDLSKKGATLEEIRNEVLEVKKNAGKFKVETKEAKTFGELLKEGIAENLEAIQKQKGKNEVNFEIKAVQNMLTSSTHTGDLAITQLNNMQARGMYKWHLRNLVGVIPTAYDTVNYAQAVVPVGEGSFGPQTEGNAKTQLDYDTKIVTLSLATEAAYAKVSRQALRNIPFLESYLSSSLTEDFLRREDTKFLNSIASSATAGSTAETIKAAKIIDFMVQVENAGYEATAFLTTPAMWAEFLKTKPNDYSLPFGFTVDAAGSVRFAGLPVYKSPIVTTNRIYVGDWSKVAIAQAESFNIRMSENDQDDFIKNLVTFRAEASIGLVEYAPAAFVFGVL